MTKVTLWLLPYDRMHYQLREQDIERLSASEFARYQSCCLSRQKEFLLGRLMLRHALSVELAHPIDMLDVCERDQMPPYVALAEEHGICFSISHSKSLISLAIARGGFGSKNLLGVDVEYIDSSRSLSAAEVFCNDRQRLLLENSADSDEKRRLYYLFWTQKEAYFKACFGSDCIPTISAIDFHETILQENYSLSAATLEFVTNQRTELYQCAVYAAWPTVPIVRQLKLDGNKLETNFRELSPKWSCYDLITD